jgi:hypothetical protein
LKFSFRPIPSFNYFYTSNQSGWPNLKQFIIAAIAEINPVNGWANVLPAESGILLLKR